MASVTRIHTLDHVAQVLGEDLEMLEEIVSNDDNRKRDADHLLPSLS